MTPARCRQPGFERKKGTISGREYDVSKVASTTVARLRASCEAPAFHLAEPGLLIGSAW
jgi:hypothetical protein